MSIKKFIKINLISLIILVYVSMSFISFAEENYEETEENSNDFEIGIIEKSEEEFSENSEESELTEMDLLRLEKEETEQDIESFGNQIQIIQEEVSSTIAEMAELNQTIYEKEIEIEILKRQQTSLLELITENEAKLEESNKRYNAQKALLEKRLVAMYEIGDSSYLEFLLSSKSISSFLSNYYMVTEVISTDNELLDIVNQEKIYNDKMKDALDIQKATLQANQETIEKTSIALSNSLILKNKRVNILNEEEQGLAAAIEEYQNAINEIETEIRLLAIANISEEYVGGVMAWPVPGYYSITSQFGMRTHPITGIYKLHTGTDIGAPYGAQFIAANDGVVVKVAYNRAYGNMVIIDHGGGISTLYAHGSEILVQEGDTVFQGDPVLKVGSTGYSTGAHAHFEVRVNGEYLDPLEYITSYSRSNKTEEVILN